MGVCNDRLYLLDCPAVILFTSDPLLFLSFLFFVPRTSLLCAPTPDSLKTYGIVLPFTPSGPKGDRSRTERTPPPPSSPAVQPTMPSESTDCGGGGEHGGVARGGRAGLEGRRGQGPAFAFAKEEEEVVMCANAAGSGEGQRGIATANAIGETTTLPSFSSGKSEKTALSPSYLCSQLVGAALSEMGVLRGGGNDLGWLWVVPGAFGHGGAVDSRLAAGVALGEEVRGDRRVRAMCVCVRVGRC